MPDADIIILSWDRVDDTIDAIRSALDQDSVDVGVIVVDQGSEPEGLARLSDYCGRLPKVRLISNAQNVGVPGGRNQGAAAGSAETIIVLDNDAVFASSQCVRRAIERLRSQPEIGALSFAVECFDRPDGVATPDLSSWVYGARPAAEWWRACFLERKFVGAGAALRRSAFEEVGGFDPVLFFLHEEEDLSERLINRGFAIAYAGDIAIRHKVSPEHRSPWGGSRMFYHARNRLYLNVKQGRGIAEALGETVVILVAALRGGALRSALRGTASGLIRIRRALAARGGQSFIARTPQGLAYMQALAEEECKCGVGYALERRRGLGRFIRRLKWETGFALPRRSADRSREAQTGTKRMREQT